MELLAPRTVDRLLSWPTGRAERLARAGKLAHVRISATGDVRFTPQQLRDMLRTVPAGTGPLKLAPREGVTTRD